MPPDYPPNDDTLVGDRYPTPATIATHMPEALDPASHFDKLHWPGRIVLSRS
ncbi:hypothetical protein [Nocardia mexicana]|uniref:hypothetical protein n=1 Tax=Nocardia mexicana TaxID=279262 RepID=UPI0012F4950C|nr:hypothetical protein [Nocardia mexicana]